MRDVIGFIGLGTMGFPMVTQLSQAGVSVVAYDALPEVMERAAGLVGVRIADSPRQVAEESAIVFTCLPNDELVRQVYEGEAGILQGASQGMVTCDCSTVTPQTTLHLNGRLAEQGVTHMDTTMLGSLPQAQSGEVFFIVAGDEGTVARIKPALDIMGRMHIYTGPSASGNKIKLIHNALGNVNTVAVAESLALGLKTGVDLNILYEVIRNGGGMAYSNYWERKVPTIIAGNYSPRFKLALAAKDMRLAHGLAGEAGVNMPILEEALKALNEAEADGLGEQDSSAVTQVIEKRLGEKISGR